MGPTSGPLNPFAVLAAYPAFRLFWLGQTASLVGSWMQSAALGWLALELSNDPFLVALAGAAGMIPIGLLSLYGGVVADRHERRRVVLLAQGVLLVEALALWALVASGQATVWWLIGIALLGGVAGAFEIPARQAFHGELVPREALPSAVALLSTGFNLARVVGPLLAAVTIARAGIAWCFAINAASYGFALGALTVVRPPVMPRPAGTGDALDGLVEGVRYVRDTPAVRAVIEIVAMGSVLGVGFITLMPVMARDVLGLGAGGYGALLACLGAGAMVAGLGLAAYGPRIARRGRFLAATASAFPAILVGYSAVRAPWLAGVALAVAGGTMILNNATANTLLQTLVPDALRGRVLAMYVLVFIGVAPVGSLLAGAVARMAGAPAAIGGLALLLLAYVRWALVRYPALRAA